MKLSLLLSLLFFTSCISIPVYVHDKHTVMEMEASSEWHDLDEDFSKWGITNNVALNNIKHITGKRLLESWNSIPHVTQFDECDITNLDKIRNYLKQKNKDPEIYSKALKWFALDQLEMKNNKVMFHGDHLDKPILIEEN